MNFFEGLQSLIKGPVFSIVTPFREEDEAIDFQALENYLHRVYDAGGRIFYVMGYNSRFSELSWEEIKILNTFVVKTAKSLGPDVIVIVADPLHCSTQVSIDFCRHSEAIGADIISLIFREKIYCNEQVARHFEMCAASTGIGILIHEMPLISGKGGHTVNWPVDLLDRLADVPNIVSIKEDAKDDDYSREVITTVRDRMGIVISGGGKRQWLKFAALGCNSWLNGIGVFEPVLPVVFYKAYINGQQKIIDDIVTDIEIPFFEKCVEKFGWHLAIKSALEALGIMSRKERMPLMELGEPDHRIVADVIASLPISKYKR